VKGLSPRWTNNLKALFYYFLKTNSIFKFSNFLLTFVKRKLNSNSLSERYLFTTLVNRALADLHHQVFGAVVGEFSSLIYFSIAVKLFSFYFLFTFSFLLLLSSCYYR